MRCLPKARLRASDEAYRAANFLSSRYPSSRGRARRRQTSSRARAASRRLSTAGGPACRARLEAGRRGGAKVYPYFLAAAQGACRGLDNNRLAAKGEPAVLVLGPALGDRQIP